MTIGLPLIGFFSVELGKTESTHVFAASDLLDSVVSRPPAAVRADLANRNERLVWRLIPGNRRGRRLRRLSSPLVAAVGW